VRVWLGSVELCILMGAGRWGQSADLVWGKIVENSRAAAKSPRPSLISRVLGSLRLEFTGVVWGCGKGGEQAVGGISCERGGVERGWGGSLGSGGGGEGEFLEEWGGVLSV